MTAHVALAAAASEIPIGHYTRVDYERRRLPLAVFVVLAALVVGTGLGVWAVVTDPAHSASDSAAAAFFALAGIAIAWLAIQTGAYGLGTFPFLAIDLSHPEGWLARRTGWRRRTGMLRWKTAAYPLRINVWSLAVSDDALISALRHHSHDHIRIIE